MQSYFDMLARYHLWATEKILHKIASVSEDDYRRDHGLFFRSLHGTLNHLLVADLHWYGRFTDAAPLTMALDAEAKHDRTALSVALRTAAGRWRDFLAGLQPQRFDADLHYRTVAGVQTVTPFMGTLAHVFNHGTHHRGQLSAAMTGMGYACPELDLIYMLREEKQLESER